MYCDGLKESRTDLYQELHEKSGIDRFRPKEVVLQQMLGKANIKILARHLETMCMKRKEILYKREKEESELEHESV